MLSGTVAGTAALDNARELLALFND